MAQAKRKQKFFDVDMPIIGKETQLYAFDIEELNGKFIKYDLTRLLRGKSLLLTLKTIIKDGKATSEPIELVVLPYFLRRMVRKGTNYVEDSFSAECKDAKFTIKTFLITRKKVSRAVRRALREKAHEEMTAYIKTKTRDELFDDILKNRFQKKFSMILKKIYPLSLCEVRYLKVDKILESKAEEEKPVEEESKPDEEIPKEKIVKKVAKKTVKKAAKKKEDSKEE